MRALLAVALLAVVGAPRVFAAVPINDAWPGTAISGATVGASGSNIGATGQSGEPWSNGTPFGDPAASVHAIDTVWWDWTAPSTGSFIISTKGSSFATYLGVFTGSSVSTLTQVAANSTYLTSTSMVVINATANVHYYICVNGAYSGYTGISPNGTDTYFSGSISLAISPVPIATITFGANGGEPSTNGSFNLALSAAAADDIPVSFAIGGTASAGTRYTAISSPKTITAGSTLLTVPVQVINDSVANPPETVIPTLSASGWGNYSIGSPSSTTVTITDKDCPSNDFFVGRTVLSGALPITTSGSTGPSPTATRESGEPLLNGNAGGASVWFQWTAPSTATYVISTAGSSFDTMLGVFTGTSVSALTLVAQNDDYPGGTTSEVVFNATAGVTYQVALDGYNYQDGLGARTGAYTLKICNQPQLNIASVTRALESGTNGSFTVTLSNTLPDAFQFAFSVGGSAAAGTRYTALPGTPQTIPANTSTYTFTVVPINDSVIEGNQNVQLTLLTNSSPYNNYTVGAQSPRSVWIVDDEAPIIYVKPGGSGNGTSWASAADLRTAFQEGVAGNQIWAAAGTYTPTATTDRTSSFVMGGADVYGGFVGTETLLSQRSWTSNATILSGDIGVVGTITDNSYHVVVGGSGTLDGFTVRDGYANGSGPTDSQNGGGILNVGAAPTIRNCVITNNYSSFDGCGVYDRAASPTIDSCYFIANPTIPAGSGGVYGGGINNNSGSSPIIRNCVFVNHNAGNGSAICDYNGTNNPTVTNCTFYNNILSAAYTNSGTSTLANCVFWANASALVNSTGTLNVTYSDVQGGWTGTGNISTDPLFSNSGSLAGADGVYGTRDDGLRLGATSPCADTGTSTGAPAADLLGLVRPIGPGYDMGAFEGRVPTVQFAANGSSASETQSSITIPVQLSAASDLTVSIGYAVTGGTAVGGGADYSLSPGTLTFPPGVTSQNITFTFNQDFIDDNDKTVIIALSSPVNAVLGATSTHTFTSLNADHAGFQFVPGSGLITTELGGQAAYTARLTSKPSSGTVVVNLSSTAPGPSGYSGGTVSPSALTFTAANWNLPQTVTITGVKVGNVAQGNVQYSIVGANATASGADPKYVGLAVPSVLVTNLDSDVAGVSVSKASVAVSESGTSDTYTVSLTSQPTAPVTVAVASEDGLVTVSPSTLTFTSSNYSTPQTVTVTGVADQVAQGAHAGIIAHSVTSSDLVYNGMAAPIVTANITDINTPGITIVESAGSTDVTEGAASGQPGYSDTYTIQLSSKPFITPTLVKDIYAGSPAPTTDPSNPGPFIYFQGACYFGADDGINGRELWRRSGGVAALFKDINSGKGASNPYGFCVVGSTLFFAADDGVNGTELWKTDGTAAGTVMVRDIAPGASGSSPYGFVAYNGLVYFAADDSTKGTELWKSDGTYLGTTIVKDLNVGAGSSYPSSLTVSGGTLFFEAYDGSGNRVWKSDGTDTGTTSVFSNYGYSLTDFGGILIFVGYDSASGNYKLFRSIGGGSALIVPTIAADPGEPTVVGTSLFFRGYDATAGYELWKYDGVSSARVADIQSGSSGSYPQNLIAFGGKLYFNVDDGVDGRELWSSDGTTTAMVKDISSGSTSSWPNAFTVSGGKLFFLADDGSHGQELWVTDGTGAGTSLVKDILSGLSSSNAQNLTDVNGQLYFSAADGSHGQELWTSDGTGAGTALAQDIATGLASTLANGSYPQSVTVAGGIAFFSADDGVNGRELWKTDGTAAGTLLVKDIHPGSTSFGSFTFPNSSYPQNLCAVGSSVFFTADDGVDGNELWVSDGTSAGTTLVEDIFPGASGSSPSNLTNVGGTLYFTADDGTDGQELWVSDGTASGTHLAADIYTGSSGSNPYALTNVGGTLYFAAYDGTNTYLFSYSGGAAAYVTSGGTGTNPNNLVAVGSTLYFSAYDSTSGQTRLWRSDSGGTAVIDAGSSATSYGDLVAMGNALYYQAFDSGSGNVKLFKFDLGTSATTVLTAATAYTSPTQLTVVGSTLYFTAWDITHGTELYATDGTTTALVKDIAPGLDSSSPSWLTAVGSALYFVADDGVTGHELWRSDGTAAGTVLAQDFWPGAGDGDVGNLTLLNGMLLATADNGSTGNELWIGGNGIVRIGVGSADGQTSESPTPLTFTGSNWNTPQTVTVTAVEDNLFQLSPHNSLINHTGVSTGAAGDPRYNGLPLPSVTAHITDDSSPPTVTLTGPGAVTESPGGTITFTVSLSKASGAGVTTTVPFSISGSAVAGVDYSTVTPSGSLVIPAGSASGTIVVTMLDDGKYEPPRALTVTLNTPTNATLAGGAQSASVTINDDSGKPTVSFAAGSGSINENGSSLTVTVTQSAASGVDTTVTYAASGNARLNTDYTISPSGSVTIPAGQTSATITVSPKDDNQYGFNRTLTLTITGATNATLGGTTVDNVTIAEKDAQPTVRFASTGQTVTEASNLLVTVSVSQSAASQLATTIPFTITGTAVAGTDYDGSSFTPTVTAGSGSLTLPVGSTSGAITFKLLDDLLWENPRTVIVTMGTPTNATLLGGAQAHTVTINDSQPKPTVSFTSAAGAIDEDAAGSLTITAQLSAKSGEITSLPLNLSGTAVQGSDYSINPAATLSIPVNTLSGSITITPIDDAVYGPPTRTAVVTMGTPTNATATGTTQYTATINEKDPQPLVKFALASQGVTESAGGTATIRVTLVKSDGTTPTTSQLATTVPFTLSGSAVAGVDYSSITASPITIPANQNFADITVTLVDDGKYGTGSTLVATVGSPTNAGVAGGAQQHILTINEKDSPPTVSFVTPGPSAFQGAGTMTIQVNQSAVSAVATTVNYSASGVGPNPALLGTDYTLSPSPLVIPAGSTQGTITVTMIKHYVHDPDKQFSLTMGTVSNAATLAPTSVTATIRDDNAVGIAVAPAAISVSTLGPTSATYAVTLTSQPHAGTTVTVDVTPSAHTTVDKATLTFDAATWNVAQVVTATGSGSVPGPTTETIANAADASVGTPDPDYTASISASVSVTVTSTGTLVVDASAMGSVDETALSSTTYTVRLSQQPSTTDVTIGLAAADGKISVSPASLVFTAGAGGNWSTPQTVTVTAVDDGAYETAAADASAVVATVLPTTGSYDQVYPSSDALPSVPVTIVNEKDSPPTVAFGADHGILEGTAGSVGVTLSKASGVDTTVPFTVGGSAVLGTDFTIAPGASIVIPAGATTASIAIAALDDGLYGPSPTVVLTMGAPTNGAISGGSQVSTTTLTEKDAAPTVAFAPTSVSVPETAGTVTVTLTQSEVSKIDTVIAYAIDGASTAVAGTDYVKPYAGASGSVTIPHGSTSAQITITVLADGLYGPDKTLILDLGAIANGTPSATANAFTATITETDPEPTVTFTSASQSIDETGSGVITAQLSAASSVATTVDYQLTGSATLGADYAIAPKPLVIPAGQTQASVTITPVHDNEYGVDKTVVVTMTTVTNAIANGTTSHTATIVEKDPQPEVRFRAFAPVTESAGGTMTVTVDLIDPGTGLPVASTLDASVPFSVGGTAVKGVDYSAISPDPSVSPVLVIPHGSTSADITVTLLDDGAYGPDETMVFTLGAPTNATLSGGAQALTATITEKDAKPVMGFTATAQTQPQTAGTITATVSIDRPSKLDSSATLSVGGSAQAGVNYTMAPTPTVTIPAGSTSLDLSIALIDDAVVEGDTTIQLDLSAPVNCTLDATKQTEVITVHDTNVAGMSVTEAAGGTAVTEGGGVATYTIALTSQPTATVTITPTPGPQLAVAPPSLSFDASNWNVPQTVTVSAPHDFIAQPAPDTDVVSHASASADPNYSGKTFASVTVAITDIDAIGLAVTQSGNPLLEGGASDSFAVALTSKPTATVTLALAADPQLSVSPSSLTFTAGDWNVPQSVSIAAVEDLVQQASPHNADVAYAASGGDYAGKAFPDSIFAINDVDHAGFTPSPSSGLTTTINGGVALFTVVLTSKPTATVTLPLSSSDTSLGTVSPASLAFTAADWNTPHIVTVTGVSTNVASGNQAYTITAAPATSADSFYSGLTMIPVHVTQINTNSAGVTLTVPSTRPPLFTLSTQVGPTAGGGSVALTGSGLIGASKVTFGGTTATITGVTATQVTATIPAHATGTVDVVLTLPSGNVTVSSGYTYSDASPAPAPPASSSPNSSHISENGGSFIYTMALKSQPTGTVTMTIIPDQQLTTDVSTLTFDAGDWNVPQTVTVRAVDDLIAQDTPHSTIIVHTASGADYGNVSIPNLPVLIDDMDVGGVTVSPASGLVVSESGTTATFTEALTSKPTSNVTIALQSSDTTHGVVSPAVMTFTPANWSTPQTATVTGVHDFRVTGASAFSILSTPSSSDSFYGGFAIPSVGVTATDIDVAQVSVSPTSGLVTTIAGGSDRCNVVLSSIPTANVTIGVSSSDTTLGTVSPASLVFTPANWNVPQAVTVTGVASSVAAGDLPYQIVFAQASSADPNYLVTPPAVSVTNKNNNTKGVIISQPGGVTAVTEAGAGASYSIKLTSQPTADVTITLGTDTTQLALSSSSLVFTTVNWSTPQVVSVAAIDDQIAQGPHAVAISHTAAGGDYAAFPISDVSVQITDSDAAGVAISPAAGLSTTEAGVSTSFTVHLTSQPVSDVVIDFASDRPDKGVASPASLTFTPTDWNVTQTVIVTGQADAPAAVAEGDVIYHIDGVIDAATADPAYPTSLPVPQVTVTSHDAALVIAPASGVVFLVENGASATYSVRLASQPTGSVTVTPSTDATQIGLNPASLTFTTANWNTPQVVTATAIEDFIAEGPHTVDIVSACSGGGYDMAPTATVTASLTDSDTAGVSVTPTAGLVTTESGGAASFTVALTSKPQGTVVLDFASDDPSKGVASPTQLTFTPATWNLAQTVTVTGQPDAAATAEGDVVYHVTGAVDAATTDPGYPASLAVPTVTLTSKDAVLVLSPASGIIFLSEGGASGTYSVRLATAPSGNVTVTASTDATQLALAPSTLTFTTADWNTPQLVSVTAVDDFIDQGAHTVPIVNACSGGGYDAVPTATISASITDADTAGVQVTPVSGLVTTEAGGSASFAVVLTSKPTGAVRLDFASDDTSKGTVSPSSLTFDASDWNIAQTVTVTGQPDTVPTVENPAVIYHVTGTVGATADPDYAGKPVPTVTITSQDADHAGVQFALVSAAATTTEGNGPGHAVVFNATLASRPTGAVTIAFDTDNHSKGLVTSTASLSFDSTDWNVPQAVTVTGVDNFTDDGNIAYHLVATVSSTVDPAYTGAVSSVAITSLDDRLPVAVVDPAGLTLTRGSSATITNAMISGTDAETPPPAAGLVFTIQLVPGQGALTKHVVVGDVGTQLVPGGTFTQQDVMDGLITYTHNNGSGSADGFAFTVTDSDGGVSTLAVFTIHITGDVAPTVTLPGAADAYTELAPPALIDIGASVADPDNADFRGGNLTVTLSNQAVNDVAHDIIGIRNQGLGFAEIGVSGTVVSYGNVPIGSISSDGVGKDLVVTLNPNATVAATQALIENLTFSNDSTFPSADTRTLTVTLNDGAGGVSVPATKAIAVTPVHNTPLVTGATVFTAEGIPVAGAVTATSPDLISPLSVTVASIPVKGTVMITDPTTGAFVYTPFAGASGTDTFTVTADDGINDGLGVSAPATVTVIVTGGTDPRPWIGSDPPMEVLAGTQLSYTVEVDVSDLPAAPNLGFTLIGSSIPAGMTLSAIPGTNTAILLWTVPGTPMAGGDYVRVGVLVKDAVSSSAGYQQLTIKVVPFPGGGG